MKRIKSHNIYILNHKTIQSIKFKIEFLGGISFVKCEIIFLFLA